MIRGQIYFKKFQADATREKDQLKASLKETERKHREKISELSGKQEDIEDLTKETKEVRRFV